MVQRQAIIRSELKMDIICLENTLLDICLKELEGGSTT